jgi:pentatricopeptide repeat protein
MLENDCRPDIVNYDTLLDGLCKHRMIDEAQQIFYEMQKQGLSFDVVTYNTLMDEFCKKGNRTEAKSYLNI